METLITFIEAERGRLSRLAADLGVTPAAIRQWDKVPADRVVAVERATGIPRQVMRPDLYEGIIGDLPHARSVTPATMDAARYAELGDSDAPRAMP